MYAANFLLIRCPPFPREHTCVLLRNPDFTSLNQLHFYFFLLNRQSFQVEKIYALLLRCSHKKKSQGVKFEDMGGHSIGRFSAIIRL